MNTLLITLVFLTRSLDFDRSQVPGFVEAYKAKYEQQIGQPIEYKVRYLNTKACSKWANDIGTSARANRWYCLAGLARRRFSKRQRAIHFLVPPVIVNGVKWMSGVSSMKCNSAVSYSVIENFNSKGEARWLNSAVAMAHEIGHSLGAEHLNTPTVMHPGALALVKDKLLDFDPASVQEIREGCF